MWLVKFCLQTLFTSPANILTDELALGLNPHKLHECPIHTVVSHLLVFEQEATFLAWNSSLSSLQLYLANSFSFRSLPRFNFSRKPPLPQRKIWHPSRASWNFHYYSTHFIALQFSLYFSGHSWTMSFLRS